MLATNKMSPTQGPFTSPPTRRRREPSAMAAPEYPSLTYPYSLSLMPPRDTDLPAHSRRPVSSHKKLQAKYRQSTIDTTKQTRRSIFVYARKRYICVWTPP